MKRIGYNISSDRRGFTLVELIVALTISIIIIGAAGSILISSTNLLAHQAGKVERETIADSTANFISDRLLFAQSIEVVSTLPADTTGKEILYIGDSGGLVAQKGYLYHRRAGATESVNAFGDSFYKRMTISLDYAAVVVSPTEALPDPPKTFEVTVHIYVDDSETPQYSITKTYQLLNSTPEAAPIASESAQSTVASFYLLVS